MEQSGASEYSAARPDSDDYDLLTYGEAAARLAEAVAFDRARLAELEKSNGDPDEIGSLKRRIELLTASNARYRGQSLSGEAFTKKFGFPPYSPGSAGAEATWD
ncbi:hypothetical protein [Nocardia arizonensis]|uniref:hypothetical protein n=1 Tax=Nocardia arizonensis TaxID=1141647 RepID=UPI0006CF31D4|nr:hypothetical protein [Nocardia arizonensis]